MKNVRIKYSIDDSDLRRAAQALKLNDQEAEDLRKELDKVGKEAKQAGKNLDKAGKDGEKSMGGLGSAAKKIGGLLVAAFAVDRVLEFGKKVLEITAEFQKLNAVLANTLGSEGLGERAFKNIQEFAATTNFSVLEATQAFVKLTNQGFQPTNEELTKLADLANSTGKSFDQLAEAIIDGQVGEFERLKEFGIRARQEGDRVTFTFKGVETQVNKTDKEIQAYILSLGELDGVQGSTAAISKTLGGQMSNLGDTLDNLFFTIGTGTDGVFSLFIRSLNDAIKGVTDLASAVFGIKDTFSVSTDELERLTDEFKELGSDQRAKELENVSQAIAKITKEVSDQRKVLEGVDEIAFAQGGAFGSAILKAFGTTEEYDEAKENLATLESQLKDLDALRALYLKANQSLIGSEDKLAKDRAKAAAEARKAAQDQLDALNKYIDGLQRLQDIESQRGRDLSDVLIDVLVPKEPPEPPELSDDIKKINNDAIDLLKDRLDKEEKLKNEALEKDKERLDEEQEARQEFQAVVQALAMETFDTLFGFDERRFEALQEQRTRELSLAGENEEAKLAIEKKFAEKENQLRREQARAQQRQAIFNMLINQGPAIAKTASTLGFPLAIPFIAAVTALFVQQIAKAKNQQLPTFHTGKKAGKLNANEVHAIVRKDEAILDPVATKMYNKHGLLDMMGDKRINPKILDMAIRGPVAYPTFNDSNIVKAINDKELHQTYISNGEFRYAIIRGRNRVNYYNSRYKLA